jgi:hypothetical protein
VLLVLGTAAAASGAVPKPRVTRIAVDPLTAGTLGQHATIVEPSSVSSGLRTVSAFQVGRNFGGGAGAIGVATSANGGRSWRSGILPAVTQSGTPSGPSLIASDPVVAYDSAHGRWLVASLAGANNLNVIFVSGSPDGLSWEPPVTAVASAPQTLDKQWLACDNGSASPFRGHCYLAYATFESQGFNGAARMAVQTSADGGRTWGGPVLLPIAYVSETDTLSAEPIVRPDGELVIVFFERTTVEAVRSLDGGTTFAPRERVAPFKFRVYSFRPGHLRAPPIPTVAVDRTGTVYAAWYDCRFRSACAGNDIVLSRSSRPGAWSKPVRIPLGPTGRKTDFVLPALAVDPRFKVRLALAFYALTSPDCSAPSCRLVAGMATSVTGGNRWRRVWTSSPMRLGWLADTSQGRMAGDYFGMTFSGGRALAVVTIARPPQGGRFDEALYAVSAAPR